MDFRFTSSPRTNSVAANRLRNGAAARSAQYVEVPPVQALETAAIALHEIGHLLHPDLGANDREVKGEFGKTISVSREIASWEWTAFFRRKGLAEPKRCQRCRTRNRQRPQAAYKPIPVAAGVGAPVSYYVEDLERELRETRACLVAERQRSALLERRLEMIEKVRAATFAAWSRRERERGS